MQAITEQPLLAQTTVSLEFDTLDGRIEAIAFNEIGMAEEITVDKVILTGRAFHDFVENMDEDDLDRLNAWIETEVTDVTMYQGEIESNLRENINDLMSDLTEAKNPQMQVDAICNFARNIFVIGMQMGLIAAGKETYQADIGENIIIEMFKEEE